MTSSRGASYAIGRNCVLPVRDADPVLPDLRDRFDAVLAELESVAGWKTTRVNRPVQILGSLDGTETGVRQLICKAPLETRHLVRAGHSLTLPTEAEMLRIKAVLILKRNATRDYVDFAALTHHLGSDASVGALHRFDELYPQPNGASVLQQLMIQLGNPMPYDLGTFSLAEYRNLDAKWHDWESVKSACTDVATVIFDRLANPDLSR